MTIPQSVAEILEEHVTLEVEGIDRMYLNVYVPRLQIVEGVLGFIRRHRGYPGGDRQPALQRGRYRRGDTGHQRGNSRIRAQNSRQVRLTCKLGAALAGGWSIVAI